MSDTDGAFPAPEKRDTMFTRSEMLLGRDSTEILAEAHVAVCGLGGVGGYAVEALARAGVGTFDLIDGDKFAVSNMNRQLLATTDTVGKLKVDVAAQRIRGINPNCSIKTHPVFLRLEILHTFGLESCHYILDAIDDVEAKVALIAYAERLNIPIISAMGAGNKLDPTKFRVADIYETGVCPLARVMRRRLRQMGVRGAKVVYSTEEPRKVVGSDKADSCVGSVSFVPGVAGLIMAGEVVKDILKIKGKQ